jgi:hypothetical protein
MFTSPLSVDLLKDITYLGFPMPAAKKGDYGSCGIISIVAIISTNDVVCLVMTESNKTL